MDINHNQALARNANTNRRAILSAAGYLGAAALQNTYKSWKDSVAKEEKSVKEEGKTLGAAEKATKKAFEGVSRDLFSDLGSITAIRGNGSTRHFDSVPVSAPVSIDYGLPTGLNAYKVETRKDGSLMVSNHEIFVDTIAGEAGATTFSKFFVNPALSRFGWLQNTARSYEFYRFEELRFVYLPARATTTTPGAITLGFDYDPDDEPPANLKAFSSFRTLSSGAVWGRVELQASTRNMHLTNEWKHTRLGPQGVTYKQYDPGALIMAVSDTDTVSDLGRIWVSYKVAFKEPQTEAIGRVPIGSTLRYAQTLQDLSSVTPSTPVDIDFYSPMLSLGGYDGIGVVYNDYCTGLPFGWYKMFIQLTYHDSTPATGVGYLMLYAHEPMADGSIPTKTSPDWYTLRTTRFGISSAVTSDSPIAMFMVHQNLAEDVRYYKVAFQSNVAQAGPFETQPAPNKTEWLIRAV